MSEMIGNVRYALVTLLLCFCASVQAQTVRGNVKDDIGEGIIGATIMEYGTKNGTVTDMEGNFTIALKGKSKKLVITYVGMDELTVDVKKDSVVNVVMKNNTTLNDVVVIGYQTVRKKDLTGAVANINSKQLKDIPVTSASEALTGKMAGVNVVTTEGSPDAEIKIRVRGGGSLSQDNSPLYIVDGFEVASISDIAPTEIESIDVLKDASSTAIYGARGANGVIIITTKSAKSGANKFKVDLGASWGFKKATKYNKVLSPYDFAYYQYELESGTNKSDYVSAYGAFKDLDIWKSREGNDFQDDIFGRTGNQQMYNLNIAGSTKKLAYSLAYANNNENSIMYGSGYVKHNINGKLKYDITKNIFFDINARISHTKLEGLSGGADTNESNASNSIVANSTRFRPVTEITTGGDDDADLTKVKNPYERIVATDKVKKTLNQSYSAGLSWLPIQKLTLRTQWQYGVKNGDSEQIWLGDAVSNSKYGSNGQPQALVGSDKTWTWSNANTATYENREIAGGRDALTVLIGEENKSSRLKRYEDVYVAYAGGLGFEDIRGDYNRSSTHYSSIEGIAAKENMLSFFGRVNYTMADKYLATLTMRADGSSLFGENNKWGYFPSAAFAWRMSEENFLKNSKAISNLKLRLSFGTAGNNRIPSGIQYTAWSMADSGSKYPWFDENRSNMMEIGSTKNNANLKWETTITRNFGIDFGFLRGRISGSIDAYWNTTKDLLMRTEIPGSSGYNYQYQNFGQTSNKGVELQLMATIVSAKNFTLNFSGNIAYNKNTIDKLNTTSEWQSSNWGAASVYEDYRVVEGGSLGEIWGYKMNGYFTCWTPNNTNGDLRLVNGKWLPVIDKATGATTDPSADGVDKSYTIFGGTLYPGCPKVETNADGSVKKQKLGNTIAPVTGGFGFNGTFLTNFDFNVFCNFSLNNKIVNGTKLALSYYRDSAKKYNLNNDFAIGNRYTWIDPETGMNLGRPHNSTVTYYRTADGVGDRLNEINANAEYWNPCAATAMQLTDYAVEDASFLRLQQVTLGYSLSKNVLKKCFLTSVRFYVTGYNLCCLTKYTGNDPEVDTSSKKNQMCPGVDYASYPKSRSVIFGLNVSF